MLVRALYTAILFITSPILLFGLYKSKPNKPKFGARWKEHFGFTPELTSDSKPLWIHAVSVGESIAAIPLIKELKARNPEQVIVVTTTTSTGAEQIEKLGELVEHRYMPIDFAFTVRGFLKAIQPEQMLIIETELWPNTLSTVQKAGIPITVVNARLSEKSCRNYQRIQPLFNLITPTLSKVLCQSKADAERFSQLGLSKEQLAVTGSIKFDIQVAPDKLQKGIELRDYIGVERPVWIAASTHSGEDEQLLEAHHDILKHQPEALLILVPRHPERFDAVFNLCQKSGFEVARRSQPSPDLSQYQIYLGDSMGEMLTLMKASDVCFMGGSLIGNKVGGHNVLEPVALGIPVITGPSYFNFKTIVEDLIRVEGIMVRNDSIQIAHSVNALFQMSSSELENATKSAHSIMEESAGALTRTLSYLDNT
ncbi:lipid IV(A) 3-deoxy-D-manno-octulosonic acid transferase [Vibrio astriarenae]|uniref:lipid IV(A) 3-deoxy-D-manno-octulosonic acid transferase n=1 Tax=Vibrio astriarenae TaxID=1481923 RepID=UPI003735D5C7